MATPQTIATVFSQAWALADEVDDVEVQNTLTELRRQSLVSPLYYPRQDYLLDKVKIMIEQLQHLQESGEKKDFGIDSD